MPVGIPGSTAEESPVESWHVTRITDLPEGEYWGGAYGFHGDLMFWSLDYWGNWDTDEGRFESLRVTDLKTMKTTEVHRIEDTDESDGWIGRLIIDGDRFLFHTVETRSGGNGSWWRTNSVFYMGDVDTLQFNEVMRPNGYWGLDAFRYPWIVLSQSIDVEEYHNGGGTSWSEEDLQIYNIETKESYNFTQDEGDEYCLRIDEDMRAMIVKEPRDEYDIRYYYWKSIPGGDEELIAEWNTSHNIGCLWDEEGDAVLATAMEWGVPGMCAHFEHYGLFKTDRGIYDNTTRFTHNSILTFEHGSYWNDDNMIYWEGFYSEQYLGTNDTKGRIFKKDLAGTGPETEIFSQSEGGFYVTNFYHHPDVGEIIAIWEYDWDPETYEEQGDLFLLSKNELKFSSNDGEEKSETHDPFPLVMAAESLGIIALVGGAIWWKRQT